MRLKSFQLLDVSTSGKTAKLMADGPFFERVTTRKVEGIRKADIGRSVTLGRDGIYRVRGRRRSP